MEKRKILVTGASGFFGGRLCHALLNQGFLVRAFVLHNGDLSSLPCQNPEGFLNNPLDCFFLQIQWHFANPMDCLGISPNCFELAFGEITDISSLHPAVFGCDIIIHSAALVDGWLPNPSRFFNVNVGGLENVIQAYKECNTVKKIIYTSSFFALGPTDGGLIADENQVHNEELFCTEYERSKLVADKVALQAASQGVPIVAVYPGVMYGPGKLTSGNSAAKMLIERFNWRLPGYIGCGSDRLSFSHVDDVVEGHILAMEKGRVGERYLLTGENASFNNVFDAAALLTNTGKPYFRLPLWLIEAYGWISVLLAWITGKLPNISPPMVEVMRHQWAYSCEKAKKELGYNPRSLIKGLEEMLLWLENSDLIKY